MAAQSFVKGTIKNILADNFERVSSESIFTMIQFLNVFTQEVAATSTKYLKDGKRVTSKILLAATRDEEFLEKFPAMRNFLASIQHAIEVPKVIIRGEEERAKKIRAKKSKKKKADQQSPAAPTSKKGKKKK